MHKINTTLKKLGILLLMHTFTTSFAIALDNGLAQTPPMGWNSWNIFNCDINESQLREIADEMVTSGMRDAGYEYLVIDMSAGVKCCDAATSASISMSVREDCETKDCQIAARAVSSGGPMGIT